jgi:hypothetical protein
MHLVCFIIRIYYDALSSEYQAVKFWSLNLHYSSYATRSAQRSMDRYHSLNNCREREPGE